MADPLISDAELTEILKAPVSAQDDAGSVTMRSMADYLAVLKFKEKRQSLNPFKVLCGLRRTAAPQGDS